MHPGKREKASYPEVSCRCKVESCTPEVGESKSSSGALPMQGWVMHPGSGKEASCPVVQENAPSAMFVGRTPSIKLLTSVNKAGDCRHEVRECTPEVGKSKSSRGELLEKPFYNFKVINPITKSNWT